jgi:hypothetical protein
VIDVIQNILDGRRQPTLRLMNTRVISWMFVPSCLTLVAIAELFLIAHGHPPVFLRSALAALSLACAFTAWRLAVARFWVLFHVTIFAHAKSYATVHDRQMWFIQVQDWMKMHGLNGNDASRLLYGRQDRTDLAWTYDSVTRRASGLEHQVEQQHPGPMQDELREIHDRLEELPQFGTLVFRAMHWRLETIIRTMQFLLVLTAVPWLITASVEKPPVIREALYQSEPKLDLLGHKTGGGEHQARQPISSLRSRH